MKKYYVSAYFLIALIISIYTQLSWTKFSYFVLGVIVNFIFFAAIYFCIKNVMPAKTLSKVMRISGAIALLMLVTVSGIWASYSGFNSRGCYDLVAKNKFTGNIKVYCDYPPWHASVMGGEDARKILLDDCLGRKSEFYLQNPNYCQVYKDDSSRKD